MVAFNKFRQFVEDLAKGVHDFDAHTFKVALTNSAPVNTNEILANITQIANGNGYTTGGTQSTLTSVEQVAGVLTAIFQDVVFTAAGGSMGPFRYAVFYNDSPGSPADPLICWHDYGSAITLLAGETFTWDADAVLGLFTIT